MKPTHNINAVLIVTFFTMISLTLPVQAQEQWSGAGMHPVPGVNVMPHQTPSVRHEVPPQQHVQPVRHDRPVARGSFYRDQGFYSQDNDGFPYVTASPTIDLPDGLETIVVDGQTFFYSDGIFYQEAADQLTVIPPVLGAVVDSIPEDYQVVMVDGINYLYTEGVYYQRVTQGFEVVQPPVSDQE